MSSLFNGNYFFFLSVDINKITTATKPTQTRAKTPIKMVPFVQETNGGVLNMTRIIIC